MSRHSADFVSVVLPYLKRTFNSKKENHMLRTFTSLKFDQTSWKRNPYWIGLTGAVILAGVIMFNNQGNTTAFNPLIDSLPLQAIWGALIIFGLRLTDVPIGTLKTVLMVRGIRTWATLLGLLEVTIWLTAMGRVMGQLDNPWNIVGYALGYSAGTWLGMWLENHLAFGSVEIHAISLTRNNEIAEIIRAAGYGVTQFQGYGQSGPLCIVGAIVERKHLNGLLKRMREVDTNVFISVDDTRQVVGGHQPNA
jgi:uncharacterized protein YebE (UPF0316 family)